MCTILKRFILKRQGSSKNTPGQIESTVKDRSTVPKSQRWSRNKREQRVMQIHCVTQHANTPRVPYLHVTPTLSLPQILSHPSPFVYTQSHLGSI